MVSRIRSVHPILKVVSSSVVDLPSPSSISMMWNFGSILGLCLITQILSGVFLAMFYQASIVSSFESVIRLSQDVNYGWWLRLVHANGASFFFLAIFFHIGRGGFYGSFEKKEVWLSGVGLLMGTMAAAFLGYVLPWGQMSFWGATVITSLLSAIPYVGGALVEWIWGGFSVGGATLGRFFTFHFLVPFILIALSVVHLVFLHEKGSSNPLGVAMDSDKVPFHPFFSWKDVVGFMVVYFLLGVVISEAPYSLGDTDNFIEANPLVTPPHIQPEWYFLFAYAILRSVPSKLGGVVALLSSILVLMVVPFISSNSSFKGVQFSFFGQVCFWFYVFSGVLLSWIGACPVEVPYLLVGQVLSLGYFTMVLAFALSFKLHMRMLLSE